MTIAQWHVCMRVGHISLHNLQVSASVNQREMALLVCSLEEHKGFDPGYIHLTTQMHQAIVTADPVQELRQKCRVSEQHIDAALKAVFGDSKQLAGREASDDQSEGGQVAICRLDRLAPCA